MQRYTILLALALFAGIGVCLGAVIPEPSFQDVLKLTNEQPDEVLSRQQRAAQGFGDFGGHGHHHGGHYHGGGFNGGFYPGGGYGGHHHHHHPYPYYGGGYYGGYPGYGYGGGYGPGFGIYFG